MLFKYTLPLFLVPFYLVFMTSSVVAQSSTRTPTTGTKREAKVTKIQERQDRLEQKAAERIPTIQQRITARAAALDERKKKILERVQTHRAKIFVRAENAVVRMDALWKRVEGRIEKIKNRGGDVSSLNDEIADVAVKRAAAVEAIRLAKTTYAGDTSLADIAADTAEFRKGLTAVKTSLNAYHQSIITVVRNLKTIQVPATPTPTT